MIFAVQINGFCHRKFILVVYFKEGLLLPIKGSVGKNWLMSKVRWNKIVLFIVLKSVSCMI